MEGAVPKYLAELHAANEVGIQTIYVTVFTGPVVEFVKNEVDKHSLETAKVHRYQDVWNKAILGH